MNNCALCGIHTCVNGDFDKAPKDCPCIDVKMEDFKQMYKQEDDYKISRISALVASRATKTRLEQILDFANESGYKNIGLAFCAGFIKEANILSKVLSYNGFNVNSVICKNGHIPLDFIDVKISDKKIIMCNPIAQAIYLNEAKTEFNIVLGLCLGHDSLFIKYSEALVTVFSVKDRATDHNPLKALYLAESDYKDIFFPEKL